MLRQEIYEKVSEDFGVSVGVANVLGYKKLSDEKEEYEPKVFKNASDELSINEIISIAIEDGKYQHLQREIYRLNQKKHPRIKELTIYKKAWKDTNGNTTTNTKRR
jgi:hypothetical protein